MMPTMVVTNRVLAAIERMRLQISGRITNGQTTKEKVEETRKKLDMDLEEYCRFQEAKSLAVAAGKLTADEGQTIYHYLGESLDTFNRQPCHVKAVLTGLFRELLEARIAGR